MRCWRNAEGSVIDETWYRRLPGLPEHTSAGGVVVRVAGGRVYVALVREGDHPEFVLPKGRAEAGETLEAAARREIAEEAGCTDLVLLGDLGARERLDHTRTAWKKTRYFLFRAAGAGRGHPGVGWFPIDALPAMYWPEQRELVETHRVSIIRLVMTVHGT